MSKDIDGGQVFKQAWVDGVRAHYPGDPKPGCVARGKRWTGKTSPWQQVADADIFKAIERATAPQGR